MLLLGAPQEVAKKGAKAFPLGSPLALPLYKEKDEINIKALRAVLPSLPTRAADMPKQKVLRVPKGY